MGLFRKKNKEVSSQAPQAPPTFQQNEQRMPAAAPVNEPAPVAMPSYDSPLNKQQKNPFMQSPSGQAMAPSGQNPFAPPARTEEVQQVETHQDNAMFIRAQPQFQDAQADHFDPVDSNMFAPPTRQAAAPKPFMEAPPKIEEPAPVTETVVEEHSIALPDKLQDNKPIYVQIDDYREAIDGVEILRQKIRDVEYTLDRLNEIKSQEQTELGNCETALNKIKERLVDIDKRLFEA